MVGKKSLTFLRRPRFAPTTCLNSSQSNCFIIPYLVRLLDTLEIVSLTLSVLIMNILHFFSYLRCGSTYGSVNCLFEENLAIPWNKNELLESDLTAIHFMIFLQSKICCKDTTSHCASIKFATYVL